MNRLYFLQKDEAFEAFQNRGEEPKGPFYFVAGDVNSPPFTHRGFAHDCSDDMRKALLRPFAVVRVRPERLPCRQYTRGHCAVVCGACEGGVPVGGP